MMVMDDYNSIIPTQTASSMVAYALDRNGSPFRPLACQFEGAALRLQGDRDAAWWASVDHEQALRTFRWRLTQHDPHGICRVVRSKSEDAPVPARIDLLHVDGNHAEQALRDVQRFAPSVPVGGILVLDDVAWQGGHVRRAYEWAVGEAGFRAMYPLGTGTVMQRIEP